jgi:hypothetical protein
LQQAANAMAGWAKQRTDDFEDRAIGAAGNPRFYAKRADEGQEVAELKELVDADYKKIVLDLRDVRLADRDTVKFLRDCEAGGMKLENCPAYLREWMNREKD